MNHGLKLLFNIFKLGIGTQFKIKNCLVNMGMHTVLAVVVVNLSPKHGYFY